MAKLLPAIFFFCAIAATVAFYAYRFNDCRRVGHATLYCIMDIGD